MNTQMKKVYLLFMAIVLTLSLQSCLHDDKTTFDLPAAERIEKKVADYKALLESSEDGWVMQYYTGTVSYTHLRAHETLSDLVCRLLLEKKK